ncbi:MAG TPA: hypothetical protein VLV54_05530 [Thermoanaerobaculia bacterium]|nr:hypothetical protein [Thermoanaerobaculia bacterium]
MRFEQHIFGRVAQGFRTQRPGFQLAAVTESLLEHPEAVEALNRLSFCRRGNGAGSRERYSLFRPEPGRVAFGCARIAKDQSGAVGSFAHNFVCSEDDLAASGASPVAIFRSFNFLPSESALPADRRLPPLEIERFDAAAPHPEWRAAALDLIDIYMGESAVVVPMVILDAERTWDLLEEIFSLLPGRETARLTFSTLFIEATDCLDAFRLVLIPDRNELPRDAPLYRIVEPTPREGPKAARRHIPWTDFWRSRPEQGKSLCRWVDLMRHLPHSPEIPTLLDELLATAGAFRAAVEELEVPGIYPWLVRKSDRLVSYRPAGGALNAPQLRDAVWEEPASRLLPALEGLGVLDEQELVALLFEDLARRLVEDALDTRLASDLIGSGQGDRFLHTVCDPRRLDDPELISLANRLRGEPFYEDRLDQAVAERALVGIARRRRSAAAERWVVRRAEEGAGGPLFAAIVRLLAWLDASIWHRGELRLRDFGPLPTRDYRQLLSALRSLASSSKAFLHMVFREDLRGPLLAFCSRELRTLEKDEQQDLLAAIAHLCQPWGREHEELMETIFSSPNAYELAKHYARCLERCARPDAETIARLRSVQPRPGLSRR